MIYLIVGRSGRGKDYLVSLMERRGLVVLRYYSTVTSEQIKESDVCVIDPNGVKELTENMPNTVFHLVYITADSRADDKIKEEMVCDKRIADEDAQFTEFEELLEDARNDNMTALPKNITAMHVYTNPYDIEDEETEQFADLLFDEFQAHKMMTKIVEESIEMEIIPCNENGEIVTYDRNAKVVSVTPEFFADHIISEGTTCSDLLWSYLVLSERMRKAFSDCL